MLASLFRQYYHSVVLLMAVDMDFLWDFLVEGQ